jgi:hypothetical protein
MKIIDIILSSKPKEIPQMNDVEPTDFENSPGENYVDMKTVFSMGDDLNKPKNPADIRTNAPSMYPGFQAGMR